MRKKWIVFAPLANSGVASVYRARRRSGAAIVELAAAAAVRLAPDYLLASARIVGAVPDPLRRIRRSSWPRSRFRRRMNERWERMTPEERERFPARDARTLRLRPIGERKRAPVVIFSSHA